MNILLVNRITLLFGIVCLTGLFASDTFDRLRFIHHSYIASPILIDGNGISPKLDTHTLNKDSMVFLQFISSAMVYNNIPDFRFGVSLGVTLDNYSFMIEPVIVNDIYGEPVLGTDYARSNISGRIENASLLFNKDNLMVQFGRSSIWWGQSFTSSIIQSGLYPSYDYFLIQLHLWDFYLEIMSGQLGSEKMTDGRRIKRHIAGHRLSWNPNNNIILGFGEQIIYTGVNRGFELIYFNPFVPYFFTGLEGDEETEPEDNDNSILFAYGRYKLNSKISVYGEIIVDDFQVDQTGRDHALGYKMGFDGRLRLLDKNFTWFLEWTKIAPWTYIHHGQYTSWQNRGHSIGFPYGPDSECMQVQVMGDFEKGVFLFCNLVYLTKGSNHLETEWANTSVHTANSLNEDYFFSQLSVIKNYKWGSIEGGWLFKPFPSTIAVDNLLFPESGFAFLKLTMMLDKEFSLK